MCMRTLSDRGELLVAERAGLFVVLMRTSPDDAAFDECGARFVEVLGRQPVVSTLIIIPRFAGATRGSREHQRAYLELLAAKADQHVGTAIAIGVAGLNGMMLRLTVNAVLMLTRPKKPVMVHGSVADAVAWLRGLPGQVPALHESKVLDELAALV